MSNRVVQSATPAEAGSRRHIVPEMPSSGVTTREQRGLISCATGRRVAVPVRSAVASRRASSRASPMLPALVEPRRRTTLVRL
ncbi:hypothetical protein G443_002581 [Actinoalloteichus cyanogriseus DSM 43889]|uniref:Uncharacterized protein n=1 Tax=Actinoalloteichus caeruleus DSM 43889 TaxID=1120930 RepID=A0ABT1JJJ0_ACTCY|nr:hypothetical protein [Actinoalloteichus caeruleus DSM 43889]